MKKRISTSGWFFPILLFLLSAASPVRTYAAAPLAERVHVQTDKQVYLAGENLWSKLYITGTDGAASSFSKIVYLELVGDSVPYVQQKINVRNGLGDSRMHLPVDLPTGHYRLVAYTRAMRNEGEQVFFNKVITVYNTFTNERIGQPRAELPEEPKETGDTPEPFPTEPDKPVYTLRDKGEIRLKGLDGEAYSLSLSIVRKEELPGMTSINMEAWKQVLSGKSKERLPAFMPEYEGHIVLGNIVADDMRSFETEKRLHTPLIAFPGNGINLFSGKIEDDGRVSFFTKRIDGTLDIVTSVLSVSGKQLRLDIQSPFASHSAVSLPAPELPEHFRNALVERSVGVQAMQAFYGDTIWETSVGLPHVVGEPDRVYILDEYTRFTTMAEVITEFVLGLRFRTIDGRRHLSSLTEERSGFTGANTLVLLDGVPLLDHQSIYDYNPLLVERINIYRGKYVFGEQMFDGIVYFQTYEDDYRGARLDASSQLYSYRGTEPETFFFMPDYALEANRYSRLPDLRHTLLWNPDIRTEGKSELQIPFYTSDLRGEFIVTVEGRSKSGKTVRSSTTFRVE